MQSVLMPYSEADMLGVKSALVGDYRDYIAIFYSSAQQSSVLHLRFGDIPVTLAAYGFLHF